MKRACVLFTAAILGLCAPAVPAQDESHFLRQWEAAEHIVSLPPEIYLELSYERFQNDDNGNPVVSQRRLRLWWESAERWRFAQDMPGTEVAYSDAAWSSGAAWIMNSGHLSVVDPDHVPEQLDPSALVSHLPILWGYWTTGFPASSPLDLEPVGAEKMLTAKGGWKAEARSTTRDRMVVLEGRTSTDGAHLLPESIEIREDRAGSEILAGMLFSQWQKNALSPSGWVAGEYVYSGPDGRAREKYSLVALRALRAEDRIGELAAVPASHATDLVRGPVTFRAITDLRPGHKTGNAAEVYGAISIETQSKSKLTRIVGWLALVALASGLIYMRLRARK